MVEHPDEPETNDPHPRPEPRPGDDFPAELFADATDAPNAGPAPEPTPPPVLDADATPVTGTEAATSEPLGPIPPTPPPRGDEPPKRPIFPVVMGILLVGALAAAIAYNDVNSTERSNAATTAAAPAPAKPEKPEPVTLLTDDVKALRAEMAGLVAQVKGLQEKVDALPKPEPPPDLKPLQAQVAELAKSSESVGPLPKRVDDLDQRVGAVDKSLGALKEELASLRNQVKKAGEQAAAAVASASKPAATSPKPETRETAVDMDEGVKLFKAGKFREADDLFLKMTETDPNDARTWYFAALSNGFATGKWDGRTAELVQKGIERERAGTPGSAEIDAAFRDLTPATGKDWLAAYRKGARR